MDSTVRWSQTNLACEVYLLEVFSKRKIGRTRKSDSMRNSVEHLVKEPGNALKCLAFILKYAQEDNSYGNGNKRIDNGRLSGAMIDDL